MASIKRRVKKTMEPEDVMLSEAFDNFINEKEALNKSKDTIRNYKLSYRLFCEYHGFDKEDVAVSTITQNHIYKWMNSMKIDGTKPVTINHYLGDIRVFLYWCMDNGREYLAPFDIKLMEKQEEQLKLFTDEELELLLEKPHRGDSWAEWRCWAIVNWALGTGNRASTICDVRIGDIDFIRREIMLRHTKNKKAQTIPLSSSLETVIKEYIRICRKEAPKTGFLFPNVGDEQMTPSAVGQAFGRYCKRRGVDKSNIHGLRHNFARGWIRNGGNIYALQQIMGHATLDMTRKYVKLFGEDLKQGFDEFNPLDTMKKSQKRTQKVKKSY